MGDSGLALCLTSILEWRRYTVATDKHARRKSTVPPTRRTVKTSLTVAADLHVRWAAAAAMRGQDRNAFAVEILTEALRSIVVIDRAKSAGRSEPTDRRIEPDELNPAGAEAA